MEPDAEGTEDIANEDEKTTIILTKLSDLEDSIQKGKLDGIKNITNFLHEYLMSNKDVLVKLYESGHKCLTQTDLIVSACFHNQVDILYYLLHETDIFDYLTEANDDVDKIDRKRVAAIRYAICSEDFNMVEMLYDYWCGDLHWSVDDDANTVLNNIQRLGHLFEDARKACKNRLIQKQEMLVNVHCLIKFNEFQLELYSKLHKVKAKTNISNDKKLKVNAVGTMLLNVLQIYNKYSYIEVVRLPKSECAEEEKLKESLKDRSTFYYQGMTYIMYEVYFRKLDFNVCLLVLEHWQILRNHLKYRFQGKNKSKPNSQNSNPVPYIPHSSNVHATRLYEEIECTLYRFIYRTNEDWRLYLPKHRKKDVKKNRVGLYEGQLIGNIELKYDTFKIYSGPVIFLERRFFKKSLKKLKNILKKHVISREVLIKIPGQAAQNKNKISGNEDLLDDNYLKRLEYMRDYYSLNKIIYYINAVEHSKDLNVLMIERTLQVIGEMLKSTEDSYHLTPYTKALLQTEISVETIKHFHNIREYLSHVDKGQLSRRIEVANNQNQIFVKVQQDLKIVIQSIKRFFDIYKSVLDKYLLEFGVSLLENRMEQIPVELTSQAKDIYDMFLKKDIDLETKYIQKGFTIQALKEIGWIKNNMNELNYKKTLTNARIKDLAAIMLPKYIENIKGTLKLIIENNNEVGLINSDLSIVSKNKFKQIPNYPKMLKITEITGKFEKFMKRNNKVDLSHLLERIKKLKDLSGHWKAIKNVLFFFFKEIDCEVFQDLAEYFDCEIKNNLPDNDTVDHVHKILLSMKNWCLINGSQTVNKSQSHKKYAFDGIEELDKNIYTLNDRPNSLAVERDELISCLVNRVDLLKIKLMYPKLQVQLPLKRQLLRYKCDQQFQFEVEMLIVDISNILVQCKIRLMNKSAKLLTGIDLGNVLDHGNPFLEVIGDTFNCQDFSTELLSKAMMIVDDRDSIAALYVLFKNGIEFNTIKWGNRHVMNDDHKKSLDQFKMSARWEDYLKLIPR